MPILYPAVFWAAFMKPISCAGFTTGFFALILLIPLIMAIRDIREYRRLKRDGLKVYAHITKCEKRWAGPGGVSWQSPYSYCVGGKYFVGEFLTSYRSPKLTVGKRIEGRCDKDDPDHHITLPYSLWSCAAELFLSCIVFIPLVIVFAVELLKCF